MDESASATPTTAATTTEPAHGFALVGREFETGLLLQALARSRAGHGVIVGLAGDLGIGKSRLASWALEAAAEHGFITARVSCQHGAATTALWPWRQLIRSLASQSHLPSKAPPDAGESPPVSPTSPSSQAAGDDAGVLDRLVTALTSLARQRPVVVLLDDLQHADAATCNCLEYLAALIQSTAVCCLLTYRARDQGPRVHRTLTQIGGNDGFLELVLAPLSPQDVAALVKQWRPDAPAAFTSALMRRTRGNPLFVTELLRLSAQRASSAPGGDSAEPDQIPLSDVVERAVQERIELLPAPLREILTVTAMLGDEVPLPLLRRVLPLAHRRRLEARLAAAHTSQVAHLSGGCVTFEHPVVAEVLRSLLPAAQRGAVHARAVAALETHYGPQSGEHAAELCAHAAASAGRVPLRKLVAYALEAGRRAAGDFAFEDSLTHLERGMAAVTDALGDSVPRDRATAELHWRIGYAHARMSHGAHWRWETAEQAMQAAFDYYRHEHARAELIELARNVSPWQSRNPFPGTVLEAALELEPERSATRANLLLRYGSFLHRSRPDGSSLVRAIAVMREASSVAAEVVDLATQARAQSQLARILYDQTGRRHATVMTGALELARRSGDAMVEADVRTESAVIASMDNDPRTVLAEVPATLAAAARAGHKMHENRTRIVAMQAAIYLGRWRQALQSGRAVTNLSGRGVPATAAYLTLVQYELDAGELAAAALDDMVERDDYRVEGSAAVCCAYAAVVTGERRHLDYSELVARRVLSRRSSSSSNVRANAALALLAIVRADRELAAEQEPWASGCDDKRVALYPLLAPQRSRLLGLLAATTGRLDQAIDHLRHAIAASRRAANRPAEAWNQLHLARVLLERAGADDRRQLEAALAAAEAIADELEMKLLQRQLTAERGRVPAAPPERWRNLTARELEVLRLVGQGMSNQEIGFALQVTEKTVAAHLTNIYQKTGAANRAQAGVLAAQHGIL